MTLVPSTVVQALLSEDIWWVYVIMGVFLVYLVNFFKKWGKAKHVLGEWRRGIYYQLGVYYVDPLKETFRSRSRRTFTTENKKVAYVEQSISGDRPVIFHDFKRARPREAGIVDVIPGRKLLDLLTKSKKTRAAEQAKARKVPDEAIHEDVALVIAPKLPKDQEDPTSTDFYDLVSEEGMNQAIRASAGSVSYGKLLVVLAFAVGITIGIIVIALGFPHGLYPSCPTGQVCTAVQQATTTTTGIP